MTKDQLYRDALIQIRERAFRLGIITCPDTCSEWEHPLCWIARTADAALRAPAPEPKASLTPEHLLFQDENRWHWHQDCRCRRCYEEYERRVGAQNRGDSHG